MEAINLNKKENIINAYGVKPELLYDIEGTLIENKGKDIKVEKNIGNKDIIYSLRLKEEIDEELDNKVLINKENILSVKTQEKTINKDEDNSLEIEKVIEKLGLEDTEDLRKAIIYLGDNQIPINKENLESFLMSKKYLEEIVENLDLDSSIKLLDRGINIEEDSLQKIADALVEIKNENKDFSLLEILGLDRKLNYKEAKTIAKEIYGRKMGKDVYDSIIALHNEGIPINKENIDKIMEIMDKAYDLRDYENENLIIAFKEDLTINIENLYKLKHSYKVESLDKNIVSPLYEEFIIQKERAIEDILIELDLNINEENINLIRGFIQYDLDLTRENYYYIMNMKSNLEEIINLLDENSIAKLIDEGIDPLNTDIEELIVKVKDYDINHVDEKPNEVKEILKDIENLKTITNRELLKLVKAGEDFKIESLKKIEYTNVNLNKDLNGQTIEKVISLNNIFNTLGELESNTIAFASRRYNTITLNNLYESNSQLKNIENVIIEPITEIEESLIRQEYLNARANTSLNLIKMSIKDGLALENMPLTELNNYIDKKLNNYKEIERLAREIKYIKGKEDYLISKVMKNELNMNLGDIKDLDTLLNSEKGLGDELNNLIRKQNEIVDKEIQKGIDILEAKIKEFSKSLKEGNSKAKDDYKEMVNNLKNLNNSFNSNDRNKDETMDNIEKYLNLQNKISKKDLVLQLPIETGDEYKNINLIIPNINKGIDANNMLFYFNINTENIGPMKVNLRVIGKKIHMEFEADKEEIILENKKILEEGLNKIGYFLEKIEMNKKVII